MSEETPNAQVTGTEPEKRVGYVRQKIRASTPKHRGEVSRARIAGRRIIKRAEKKLGELLKDVPEEYLDRALRRLGEQLNATKKIWDMNAKRLIDIPDEKIRQDAALAILAYKWGRPVERNMNLNADVKDFPAMLDELTAQSPAFQAIEAECSRRAVEGKRDTSALPQPS